MYCTLPKRKRGEKEEVKRKRNLALNRKKHSTKRWVVERTNSWHNRFRKLFTRYEKKAENYLDWYSSHVVSSSIER